MKRSVLFGAALMLVVLLVGASDPPEVESAVVPEGPMHADSEALLKALGETARCLAREDAACTRAALDRMEPNCARIQIQSDTRFDDRVRSADRAFHATVDRARELASAGEIAKTSQQFTWIRQTCLICHEASRRLGIGPALPVPNPTRSDED